MYVRDTATQSFLLEQKQLIIRTFSTLECTNVRILISVFCSFEAIYNIISGVEHKHPQLKDTISTSMLLHLTKSTIRDNEGLVDILETWETSTLPVKQASYDSEMRAKLLGELGELQYYFIDYFVKTHFLSEDEVVRVFSSILDEQYRKQKIILDNLAMADLSNWHLKDHDTISKSLTKLSSELKKELYTAKEIRSILMYVLDIEYFNAVSFKVSSLKEEISSYYSNLLDCQEVLNEESSLIRFHLPSNPETRDEYKRLILGEINKKTILQKSPIEKVASILENSDSNWFEKLDQLISGERNDLILNDIMTYFSTCEYFWSLLSNAPSEILIQCEKTIYHIYEGSRGHTQYKENLIIHKSRVEKLIQNSTSGQIKYCFTRFLWIINEELEKYTEKETTS